MIHVTIDVSLEALDQNKNCKNPYDFPAIHILNSCSFLIVLPEPSFIQTKDTTIRIEYSGTKPPSHTSTSSSVTSTNSTATSTACEGEIQINAKVNISSLLDASHWFTNIEHIVVTIAPEREGFIFKHVNYILINEKQSSLVLRRYSDFCWLLDVLTKRYPFRVLPGLPPKKIVGNNSVFLEKRRRGLSRFINAIMRHPVLRQDDMVTRFLTEPSELAAWYKQNPPSLHEETMTCDHKLLESVLLEHGLEEKLHNAKKKTTASITQYIQMGFIMERIVRRMHGQAADFSRYSVALK